MLVDNALNTALVKYGAKNEKAVKALMDTSRLVLDKNQVIGIKEQIEEIKKECSYLFNEKEITTGAHHGVGIETDYDSMSDKEYYNYILNKKGNE